MAGPEIRCINSIGELYSVPGIVESWSICSEDVDWIPRDTTWTYDEYKKWYWGLKDSFNPVDFNPDQWADVMEDAGMRYVVFTTKHHDGSVCMIQRKPTSPLRMVHSRIIPRKDVARYVFDAFRKKDFMIGAYFSKPTGIVRIIGGHIMQHRIGM